MTRKRSYGPADPAEGHKKTYGPRRPQTGCVAAAGPARAPRATHTARLAGAVLSAAVLLALTAGPALAGKSTVNTFGSSSVSPGTTGGLFNTPRGVAVNQTGSGGVPAGTTYVVDAVNRRVQRFGPTGAFVSTWGKDVDVGGDTSFEVCTVAASCKRAEFGTGPGHFGDPTGIAIDQANGNVYVADQDPNNLRISVFSATGVFHGAFGFGTIDGSSEFQFCTTQTGCSFAGFTFLGQGGEFGNAFDFGGDAIGGLAVDGANNLYVASKTNRRVDVFAPTFTGNAVTGVSFVRAFGWDVVSGNAETGFEVCTVASDCKQGTDGTGLGQFGGGSASPSDVAVDSSGNIYALDFTNKRVQRFDSTATPTTASFGSAALSGAFGTGNLLNLAVDTTDDRVYVSGASSVFANKVSVAELDPAGASVDSDGSDLTIVNASGLAVAPASIGGNLYLSSNNGGHRVYVLNTPPTIDPVTVHTGTTATFSGSVVSNGLDVSYHFEYSTDGTNWTSLPTPDADAGSAPGTIAVSQDVTGLSGSQLYRVRLVQNRPLGGGSMASAETSFTTDPAAPAVSAPSFADLASTAATLKASIDPQHQATGYHFEYTDDADFQANGFANAARAPAVDASAGAGGVPVAVAQHVTGLQPATVYHFRAVATNPTGTTAGPERTFKTLAPGSEDCSNVAFRTGPSANLPDCRAYELVTPPDTNGSTVFAKGLGEGQFDGGFEMSLLSPSADSAIFQVRGSLPGFEGAGGSDVYRASRGPGGWSTSTLTPSGAQSELPFPGGVSADHDYIFWLAPGGCCDHGSLVLGGQTTRYVRGPDGSFELIGRGSLADDPGAIGRLITAGADQIVFTSLLQLEPEAPAAVGSAAAPLNTARVGAVYDRTPGGPTRVVSLLPGNVTPGPGTTTFYRGVAADGSAVVFSVDNTMYVRRDNVTTVAVASATSPRHLAYAGVSPGGGRVFYVRPDALSNPAVGQLFAFDSDTQATTAITGGGGAQVVNISADGSHLYFVSPEQLDGGNGTAGAENLYVWDGSDVRFIAVLQPTDVSGGGVALGAWTPSNGARKGAQSGLAFDPSRTTPDGSVFVFESRARLTDYDNGGRVEIYRYDADADELTCVSCNPEGEPAASDATFQQLLGVTNALIPLANLTGDGESVFFESADALVPEDINSPCPVEVDGSFACVDVYQWKDGNLSLISSGRSSSGAYLWAVSPDGRDVLFRTADSLAPQDPVGGEPSVYDARVGGGFPAGQVSPPCVEDACQGEASVPAVLPTAATVSFAGLGNPRSSGPLRASERVSVRRPRSVRGFAAKLKVRVPAAGLITVSGASLRRATRRARRAGAVTLPARLTAKARRALKSRGKLKVRLRVGYKPATGSASAARVALTFKRPKQQERRKSATRAANTSGRVSR